MREFTLRGGSDWPVGIVHARPLAPWWHVKVGAGQRECVGTGTEPESRVGLGRLPERVEASWGAWWRTRG